MSEPTAPLHATAVAATPDTAPRRDVILARKGAIARIRALRRAIAMVLVTAGICISWSLGALCLFWSRERRRTWRRVLMRRWCKLGCAALGVRDGADAPAALRNFCEDVYLHQTRRRSSDGTEHAFADLPEALAAPAAPDERWRVHFHVPLFFEGFGDLRSTQSLLTPRFARLVAAGATEHLEIETYTYGVLPADLATGDLAESIAREYRWTLSHLLCETAPADDWRR
jgi:hypothetical protein